MDSTQRSWNGLSFTMFIVGCIGIGLFFFGDRLKKSRETPEPGYDIQREINESHAAWLNSKDAQPDPGRQTQAATANTPDLPNVNSFQRQVFTNPRNGFRISLVTATQCEIEESGATFVGDYSKQGEKLRIVANIFGNGLVHYYDIEPDAIREVKTGGKSGARYLNADALARFDEAARIASQESEQKRIKAEAARLRAEAERIVREKAERTRKIDEEKEWLRTFFDKEVVLSGSVNGKKFEFVAQQDIEFAATNWSETAKFGGETVQFAVVGELKWTDGKPWTLLNDGKMSLSYQVAFYGQFSPWDEYRVPYAKLLYFNLKEKKYANAGYEAAQKGGEFQGQGGFSSFNLRKMNTKQLPSDGESVN